MGPGINMSDSESKDHSKSLQLTSINYNTWTVLIQGKLMTANGRRIITEELKEPTDADLSAKWKLKRDQATGIIPRSLSTSQYIHVEGIMDDPIAMWKKPRSSHRAQVANSRYHVIQKLLSICKDKTESLTDYVTRVNTATNNLIALTPSTLTIKDILDKIGMHAAISGLDQTEYGAFTSYSVHLTMKQLKQCSEMRS